MANKLLASASTLEGSTKQVNEYYYSDSYKLVEGITGKVWYVVGKGDVRRENVLVRLARGRYRFEQEAR